MGDSDTDTMRTTTTARTGKEFAVVHDQGLFLHATSDMYEGHFEAKKKDKSVKMHGLGVYTTAEGDIYSGTWEYDRLVDNVSIVYTDGSRYEGPFKDWSYSGQGSYTYPDTSVLQAEFVNNFPNGTLTLHDPNGHRWLGTAELGYAWFEPVNHYYEMLETTCESRKKGRKKNLKQNSAVFKST